MSLAEKIDLIRSKPPKQLPNYINELADELGSMEDSDLHKFSEILIGLINDSNSFPSVVSASIEATQRIVENGIYPKGYTRKLLVTLKPVLGSNNKSLREKSLNAVLEILPANGPKDLWDELKDIFDKGGDYKNSGLILLLRTINDFPEYKVNIATAKTVLKFLNEPSNEVVYEIAQKLYERNPNVVEKIIKTQFPSKSSEIINKINGNKRKSSSRCSHVSQQAVKEETVSSLKIEFENPFDDIQESSGICPFDSLGKSMGRNVDWQDRGNAIRTLVSYAKKTKKDSNFFASQLKKICDPYLECLCDARSTLSKLACLSLVCLAQNLKQALDVCSDWLIPPLLTRTSNGTGIIAIQSELAVTNYVKYVSGKRIKKILIDNANNPSVEARLTVIKAMIIAIDNWIPDFSKGFDEILEKKKKDQSNSIRTFLADYNVQGKEDIPKEKTKKQETVTFGKPKAIINKKNNNIKREKIVKEEVKQTKEDKQIKEENNVISQSISELIEDSNTKGIARLLENDTIDLFGEMSSIISILLNDIKEESFDNAEYLFSILCEKYKNYLYPFLTEIINSLPENNEHGIKIISELSLAFGEIQVAKLCLSSKQSYAITFTLEIANKYDKDFDLTCQCVSNAITKNFYEENRNIIISLLKRLFNENQFKCEGLIMSLSKEERFIILKDVMTDIPKLYQIFDLDFELQTKLNQELIEIRSGKDNINYELLKESKQSESTPCHLLSIAIIRDFKDFSQDSYEYLLECLKDKDISVQTNSSTALRIRAENGQISLDNLLKSKDYTYVFFKILSVLIEKNDAEQVEANSETILEAINCGILSSETKYSALDSLAKFCIKTNAEPETICILSAVNQYLLKSMIASKQ